MVDLVAAALRELYEETFAEDMHLADDFTFQGAAVAAASPQMRFPPDPTAKSHGGPIATSPPVAERDADENGAPRGTTSAEATAAGDGDNVQRKIRVWWEGLELGAAEALARRQLSGRGTPRQPGLVVCATLVDKAPNLAGLTRTCEVFGASLLALPNLGVLQSDTFKQISVTAEGWVPLEEVKPSGLLAWLRRKKREGFTVVGLEQTAKSVPLAGSGSRPLPARTVLLLGKEKEGIPVEFLREVVRVLLQSKPVHLP